MRTCLLALAAAQGVFSGVYMIRAVSHLDTTAGTTEAVVAVWFLYLARRLYKAATKG